MAVAFSPQSLAHARQWLSPTFIAAALFVLTQNWSGLDTPDSEFYASLAIFTDQITDRAPIDSYYWTRLGMIGPAHLAISFFGIWEGFAVYKAFLILVLTASIYAIARTFTGFWRATWLTAAASSSSIVLAYLGNPYVAGTVLAGLAALLALSIRSDMIGAAGSGVALGWLVMTYPTGALLGATLWTSIQIYSLVNFAPARRKLALQLIVTASCVTVTAIVFWLVGRSLFPRLDWLQTYVQASSQDHSVYGSGEWVWLRDPSLLIPTATLVVAIINRYRLRRSLSSDLAVIFSSASITFYLIFAPIFGAQFLEAPPHQVLLWIPTLTSIVLVATSRMVDTPEPSRWLTVIGILVLAFIIGCGWLSPNFSFVIAIMIAITMIAILASAPPGMLGTFLAVGIFLIGSQLLQNSRPQLGTFMLDPYFWAYTANPNEAKLRTAVNAQKWLLDNTRPDDSLLLWVDGPWREGDRELYSVAAMQLWGENRLSLEPTLNDQYGLEKLASTKPTALVLYGKSMDAIWDFWESIPREFDPGAPDCYDFSWPVDPTSAFPTTVGHSCLVRLALRNGGAD